MGFMSKKPKKTQEEIRRETREKAAKTSGELQIQIMTLNKKKDTFQNKMIEARRKGLKEQEMQARGLLKQTMASIKRAEGMLFTLELAMESRDLAELNVKCLDAIGSLSEDVIGSSKQTSASKAKKINDTYLRARFESTKQASHIDDMLAVGEYASVATQDEGLYSEFDDEIDGMLEDADRADRLFPMNRQKY